MANPTAPAIGIIKPWQQLLWIIALCLAVGASQLLVRRPWLRLTILLALLATDLSLSYFLAQWCAFIVDTGFQVAAALAVGLISHVLRSRWGDEAAA